MITGAHILLYSEQPEADRAFFRDVLGFPAVDAGEGWLIFALPPSEAAFHPVDGKPQPPGEHRLLDAALYFMCNDLRAYLKVLEAKKVRYTKIDEQPWGMVTTIRLPSGGEVGLYEPHHPTALDLNAR